MQHLVSYLGVGVLLALAILGSSAVMAVSAAAIGLALWITRNAPLRARLLAVVGGALGGSLLAETVHTAYHLLGGETASGDGGFFFASAVLVGAINAVAMLAVMGLASLFRSARPAG
ncbi:MAG: hypothetical protein ABJF88_14120 [Rhodothermales bacterium]